MKLLQNKKWIGFSALLLVILLGGTAYYQFVYKPNQAAASQPTVQTSVVRQGNLVIYASGSGTLIPANEYDLSFAGSGMVTKIFAKAGDQVKKGELLAQVDDSKAQDQYTQVKLNYQELTSAAAIASAQQSIADAEKKLQSAQLQLEYLISPDVMYWDSEITNTREKIQQANQQLKANPNDAAAQKALKDAQAYLDFAEYKLSLAQKNYEKVYIYQYFVVHFKTGDSLVLPTAQEISSAHAAIDQAQINLKEAKELYDFLTGQPVPANASGPGLLAVKQAKLDLDAAQAALDGTRILAPSDGLVTSVNVSPGNAAASPAIVLADISQVYLQIYMDPSDWSNVAVGKEAQISFDALPGKTFAGKVTEVDSQLYTSGNTSTVRGLVLLDEPYSAIGLPLGINANVDVIGAQAQNVLLVPVGALRETAPGTYAVYVMVSGKPELRQVTVGIQDPASAQILSGLQAGDVVIANAAQSQ